MGQTCATKSGQVYKSSDDAWGNVTNRTYQGTAVTLAYDPLDQLVKWSDGSGSSEFYAYDATGSRTLRRSTSSGTTTLTVYAFGVEEHLYSGTGSSQGNTYYYTLGGRLIGERTTSPAATTIFLTDALGSVLMTFSNAVGSAAVLGSQVYGPYGTQRYASGSMGTSKGFTGQYNDTLTGLDYYNARYYDPVVGVFLSADTVQGNLQGLNPYNYVGGNPETRNDPTGRYIPCPDDGCGSGGGSPTPPPSGGHRSGRGPLSSCDPSVDVCTPQPPPTIETLLPQESPWQQFLDWLDINRRQLLSDPALSCGDQFFLSFTATTQVATAQGEKPIGSLRAGEKVWAYNPQTRKMELQPIVHVWINHDNDLVDLTIASLAPPHPGKSAQKTREVIHTTKKHPFLTVEKGFVPVAQLHTGMHVVSANGTLGMITRVKSVPGASIMYNLEVAQDHTYVVGNGKWVVHNCSIAFQPGFDERFRGMAGAPLRELLMLLPAGYRFAVIQGKGGLQGYKWSWTQLGDDGLSYNYELRFHSPDPKAMANNPTSNAANGWTWRLQRTGGTDPADPKSQGKGSYYMDGENGKWYKESELLIDDAKANATHNPMNTPTEEEMQNLEEMFMGGE